MFHSRYLPTGGRWRIDGENTPSSQDSQVPQGVTPPAQLCSVPPRLTRESTSSSRAVSNTSVVVPPSTMS